MRLAITGFSALYILMLAGFSGWVIIMLVAIGASFLYAFDVDAVARPHLP